MGCICQADTAKLPGAGEAARGMLAVISKSQGEGRERPALA